MATAGGVQQDRPRPAGTGNIVLVGPMGVGKTTVGRILARQLGKDFVDCDLELERRTGVNVATIFEIEGEAGFRRRESQLLAELGGFSDTVIATGGGAVLLAPNRDEIRRAGTVVYLTAPVRQLVRRTRNNRNRPLLNDADPERVLTDLMAVRDPLYREVADFVIKVDDRAPRIVGRRIQELLEKNEPAPG